MIDQQPHDLSFKNKAGDFVTVLPKDTSIPNSRLFTLSTSTNTGAMTSLEVYEMSRKPAHICTLDLTEFEEYQRGEDLIIFLEVDTR